MLVMAGGLGLTVVETQAQAAQCRQLEAALRQFAMCATAAMTTPARGGN
jgi:hypothetical protein